MSNNPIPAGESAVTTMTGSLISGLKQLAAELEITQVTASGLQARLDAYTASTDAFNRARSAQQAAYDTFHLADDALKAWLTNVGAVLTIFFGSRWNAQWVQAGYANGSSAVPKSIENRMGLAQRLCDFFAANPAYEIPVLKITAAEGTAALAAAVAAQRAVISATTRLKQAKPVRTAALAALKAQLQLLIHILEALLPADDSRWKIFGLNLPAAETTPAPPQDLTISPLASAAPKLAAGESAMVLANCAPVPLATRYRWRMRPAGVAGKFTLVASTKTPLARFAVPPGVPVEILVQAVNGPRQSVPGAPVIYGAGGLEPLLERARGPLPEVLAHG
jgi:hypothetical protein